MKPPRRFLTAVLALVCLVRLAAADAAKPVTILLVRHGEKSEVSGDVPMSANGRARAALLARMVQDARVTAVFSSELTFAQETANPVAARFNVKPTIVPVRETGQLLAQLEKLPPGAVAFVVNHSSQLGDIVEKLSGTRPTPDGPDAFDRLWVVTRPSGAPASLVELHFGDIED